MTIGSGADSSSCRASARACSSAPACSRTLRSCTSSNCSRAAARERNRLASSSVRSPLVTPSPAAAAESAGAKTGPPSKGSTASLTCRARGRNSSAVAREMGTRENRFTANRSPAGSTPPKPSTDSIPNGTTNSSWAGMDGLPRARGTWHVVGPLLQVEQHVRIGVQDRRGPQLELPEELDDQRCLLDCLLVGPGDGLVLPRSLPTVPLRSVAGGRQQGQALQGR